jgi:hypothetical protein
MDLWEFQLQRVMVIEVVRGVEKTCPQVRIRMYCDKLLHALYRGNDPSLCRGETDYASVGRGDDPVHSIPPDASFPP